MTPRISNKRPNAEYTYDLIKSIADIANLTPDELIRLLRQPEERPMIRKSRGIPSKTVKSRRKRSSKCSRRPLHAASWLTNESSTILESSGEKQSVQHDRLLDPDRSIVIPHVGKSEYGEVAALVPNDIVDESRSPSSCRSLEACQLCPDWPAPSEQQASGSTQSNGEMCSSGPETLSEYMDFFDPDLAYSNVITVGTETGTPNSVIN
ncbi:hypothetical protein LSH36_362g02002 [Paralvinella palmiformis]|uniref:Uncharacterized protein n=1 Tax=Paralvinella palmiformis TaxID=53620 RepID=A0AAD9JF45_9ANNE|nr:hypothetical protein LSH36_362g02002 [Paralvinella palmiformis]